MRPVTIELTAKRWKAHKLIAIVLVVLGLLACIHSVQDRSTATMLAGWVLIGAGCGWWLYARFRAWWGHG